MVGYWRWSPGYRVFTIAQDFCWDSCPAEILELCADSSCIYQGMAGHNPSAKGRFAGTKRPRQFYKKQIGHVNLAFARLAIVDPTTRSDQPFLAATTRLPIIQRTNLQPPTTQTEMMKVFGIKFKTESDTEVLYLGIKNFGKDFAES